MTEIGIKATKKQKKSMKLKISMKTQKKQNKHKKLYINWLFLSRFIFISNYFLLAINYYVKRNS
jgi:hypothetical protein